MLLLHPSLLVKKNKCNYQIQLGYECNFDKYDTSVIQSLGAKYDYGNHKQ